MAMLGLSCRREVEASLDSPSNELSLPCKQEVQNALSGFSHVRARRPQYTVVSECSRSRAGPGRRRGAAHPRGDRNRETPARHRRVLCRRGPGRRPGALHPAATEGRGRIIEEKEEPSAVEEEGVLICVHSVRKGGIRAYYYACGGAQFRVMWRRRAGTNAGTCRGILGPVYVRLGGYIGAVCGNFAVPFHPPLTGASGAALAKLQGTLIGGRTVV